MNSNLTYGTSIWDRSREGIGEGEGEGEGEVYG
jgi:hypothetical protein